MAVQLPNGKNQFFDSSGNMLAGGRLYTYVPGTSTPKAAYTTSAGTTAHTNPIVLDSRGEAAIYWTGAYDVVLRTAADALIWGPERLEESASALAATGGADLVGFSHSVSYATSTVGKKLKQVVCVDDAPYGALGDNSTDDLTAVQAAIDAVNTLGGGTVIFRPGATYRMSAGPVVKTGVKLDLNGATVNLVFGSGADTLGFDMRQDSAIMNGTVNGAEAGAPTSSDKDLHCPIVVGRTGGSLAGYNNVRISDLRVTNTRSGTIGGRGILVQSGSSNVIVENIDFPDSSTLGSAVQVSWAGPGGAPPATSEHPFNVTIRNIRLGTMTKAGSSFDVAAIDIVGAYNVLVENVDCERWAGDALVQVRVGGFGATVCPAAIAEMLFRNIVVRNVTAQQCDQHCVIVNGRANDASGTPTYSVPCLIQNVKAAGIGSSSTYAGIRVLHSADVTIENCEMEEFDRGLYIEEGASRVTVRRGRYFQNNESGIVIVHGTTLPDTVNLEGVESYLNGQDGGNHAGFYVESCYRVHFKDCIAGDASSETTQLYGFRVLSTAVGTRFSGVNRVRNVDSGGTKYLFAAAVTGDRQFSGGTNADLSTGSNEFAPIVGVGLSSAEATSSVLTSCALVLTNFTVKLTAAPGSGKSRGLRVVDDGSATALEISVADLATTGSDYDAVEVAAGSELSVQSLPTSTPAAARAKWSCEAFQA